MAIERFCSVRKPALFGEVLGVLLTRAMKARQVNDVVFTEEVTACVRYPFVEMSVRSMLIPTSVFKD